MKIAGIVFLVATLLLIAFMLYLVVGMVAGF